MYENLKGKRLLIIGSDGADAEIVKTAKSMGIYTICADGKPCSIETPAKRIADEAWTVDYYRTDELAEMAKTAHVDGVLAGYSEFRVIAAIRVAEKLGLPAYTTEEILNITRHKRRFKETCRKYGVKVPEFVCFNHMPIQEETAQLPLPCIIKPVDAAGKKGITVCKKREQILPALEKAFGASVQKEVIVEEFLSGTEALVRMIDIDGVPTICCVKDKFILEDDPNACLGAFTLYVPATSEQLTQDFYSHISDMLKGLGIRFGVLSFQCMRDADGYSVFECNYRIGTGNDQRMMEYMNGINYVKMMIEYALTGKTETKPSQLRSGLTGACAKYSVQLKPGTIGKMEYPKPGEPEHVVDLTVFKEIGMTVGIEKTTDREALCYYLVADTIDQIKRAVTDIDDRLDIRDVEGNSMLYAPFRTERLDPYC